MSTLPDGFSALEPYVAIWTAPDLASRAGLRDNSTEAERRTFHAVMGPPVVPALERLAGRALDTLDAGEQCLLDLVLAYPHVAMAVEVQGDAEARHAALRGHMRIS